MRQRLLIGALVFTTIACWYAAYRVVRFTIVVAGELERANNLTSLATRAQATLVTDRHGRPAFSFYTEQRIEVPLDRVSRHMREAIVAVEDRRFYSHYGLDPVRIVGAAVENVRAGRILQGGSTLTQQLARAGRLSSVRTFERKLREAMIALRLEQRYTKSQILQEYLNTVYFGEGLYGVEAASRGYFRKTAADLTPCEAAMLAGVVRAPSLDSPFVSSKRALERRNLVLRLMREQDRLTDAEFDSALRSPLPDRGVGSGGQLYAVSNAAGGEYFREEVRRQLFSRFGAERVLRGGLRVESTYDPSFQQAAEEAIRGRIAEIVKQRPRAEGLQGSLVAIDPETGDVLALVGGRNFDESSFNRATQARRPAGSAFKPIVFAAALERGYSPATLIRDLDVPIYASAGELWLPSDKDPAAEETLRSALKVSSNRAAAHLLQEVGLGTTMYYARRLGIGSALPSVPSLALGTGEVTLLELTAAYGAFANQGMLASPRLITRVEDAEGTLLWSAAPSSTRAVSQGTAFLMSSMLADVVSSGTATRARSTGFSLPAGGKTGTTDDYADTWFVGYTPHLVAGVWFGFDNAAPIVNGGVAGIVAVPAWARFMKAATAGAKPDWYAVPAEIEKVAICRMSGVRAREECKHAVTEPTVTEGLPTWPPLVEPLPPEKPNVFEDYFPIGAAPADLCPLHGQGAGGQE